MDNSKFTWERRRCETDLQIRQAGQRGLRHPWPRAGQGAPDAGRRPPHHPAQHRQRGRLRPHAARRDRAGHDPQPARRRRLHRQQGPLCAAQGGGALHAGKRHRRRHGGRRLPGQRRV